MALTFELARPEHAKAIFAMRLAASEDLASKLGPGRWGGGSRLQSIKERIGLGDPETLRHNTLYVACRDGEPVGSVVVSTFPPGFWRRSYWQEPSAKGLGVFSLVVHPEHQRRGIGRFVMDRVEDLACIHGLRFVRLDAYTANPFSVGFYRSIGYEARAEIDLRGVGLVLFEKSVGG
jgi:GNAT superfamily N-acetyltransferase